MLVGVWVMAFLFLGFPSRIEQILALITGLIIVIGAYRMNGPESDDASKSISFVEHKSEPILSVPVAMEDSKPEMPVSNISSLDQSMNQ